MKNSLKNFTVLIQGPIHPNCMVAFKLYAKDYPIILSTWSTPERHEEKIKDMISETDYASVVSYNLDSLSPESFDGASRYKQFLTTLRGLKLVDTEYVIKLRSDEYYTDLTAIVNKVLENPEKIVTNNVFFRKTAYYKFHPSDHVIAGKTTNMISLMKECVADCELGSLEALNAKCRSAVKDAALSPEQQIGVNWILLNEKKLDLNKEEIKVSELMTKYFDVVPLEDMGFYSVAFSGKNAFFPETFFQETVDIKSMKDL